jgi:transcriptional regulator with XRE-family HTH domain
MSRLFSIFLINREEEIPLIYNKIIKYCNENSLSVSAFEKKCGLANGTVGKWKDGGNPSLETLHKIVLATGIPIDEWMKESEV